MSGDEFLEQVPQYTLNTLDDGTEEKLLLVVQLPGIQRADQLVVRIWEDNIFIHAEGRYRLDLDLDVRIEDKPAGLRFVKKKAVLKAEFLVCPSPPGAPTKAGRGSASSQASRGEVHDSFLADALKLRDGARASPGRSATSNGHAKAEHSAAKQPQHAPATRSATQAQANGTTAAGTASIAGGSSRSQPAAANGPSANGSPQPAQQTPDIPKPAGASAIKKGFFGVSPTSKRTKPTVHEPVADAVEALNVAADPSEPQTPAQSTSTQPLHRSQQAGARVAGGRGTSSSRPQAQTNSGLNSAEDATVPREQQPAQAAASDSSASEAADSGHEEDDPHSESDSRDWESDRTADSMPDLEDEDIATAQHPRPPLWDFTGSTASEGQRGHAMPTPAGRQPGQSWSASGPARPAAPSRPGSVAGAASERKASEPVDPILRARKDDSASRRRDLQPESSGDLYEEAKAQANKEAAREWHARAVAAAQASDLEGAVRMLKKANSISGGEYAVDLAKAEQRVRQKAAREAQAEAEAKAQAKAAEQQRQQAQRDSTARKAAQEQQQRQQSGAQRSTSQGSGAGPRQGPSSSYGSGASSSRTGFESQSGFGTARPEAEDESEDDSTDEAHKFEGQRPGESAPHFWLRFARAFAWACLLLMWQSGIQPLWRRAPYTLPRICRLLGAPRAAQWIMDQLLAGSGAAFHALRLLAGVVALALAGVALLLAGHVLYWAWLLLSVVLLFTFWQPHWWATAALAATIAYQRQSTLLSMFWSFPVSWWCVGGGWWALVGTPVMFVATLMSLSPIPGAVGWVLIRFAFKLAWYKAAVPLVVIVAVFVLYCTYIRMDADESSSGGGNLKSEVLRGAEGEVKRILAATDHYMVLEVARDADEAAIRKAKKVKALQSHPDKLGGAVGAKEAFQRVTAASELLSNPAKRRAYDRELAVREYKAQQAQRSRGGGGGASSSTSSAEVDARTDFAAAACEAAAAGGYAFDGNIPQNIKMAAPPLLIACVNCRKDHLCFAVDVPREAARYCSHCNTRHAAHDGQGWLEKDGFFSWKAYCCSRGEIYEITHWAQCSRAVYDPDTGSRYPCDSHTPALNFQAGGRPGGAGGARGGGRRGTPQHAPQPQAQQTPRGGKRRKGGRRR